MVRAMCTLGRDKGSGSWVARKAVPPRLRDAYAATFGKSWEEKFARPSTLNEREARVAFADWLANVEARINLVAAEAKGEGADLTHVQAHALAGRWYRWKTERHGAEPGAPQRWSSEIKELVTNISALAPMADNVRPADPNPNDGTRFADLVERLTHSRSLVLDRIAAAAELPEFLARERLALNAEGRKRFLCALVYELVAANALLLRRAHGDYAPDLRPARFPEWRAPNPETGGPGMSAMKLYQAWCKANEKRTSPSTRSRWITVFRHMDAHFKQGDVLCMTEEQAIAWREDVRAGDGESEPRSDKTINFQYVAAAKAVFGWAARPKTEDGGALISANPFANFRFSARKGTRKTVKLRERSFRLAEMKLVLPAAEALKVFAKSKPLEKAKKWAPWVLAYTGSRPGEVCQLRKEDLHKVQGRWAFRLTPEAGTIKDREARMIPIHLHLIEMGLIEFIEAQPPGPLFYDAKALRRVVVDDPANPRRFPHEKVANKLGEWVRGLGVTDPSIKPNHAWRHTFKTRAIVSKIDSVVADFICGHAPKTVGDTYYALEGDEGWPALVGAIDAFPRYKF
jgi:integrase